MLRFLTAGESHGRALIVILEGIPAGLTLDGTQYRLLCEMVGATRESVSIVVNRLIADGLAERNGGGFVVQNLADLTARVGGSGRDGELVIPLGIESDNGQSASGRTTGQG